MNYKAIFLCLLISTLLIACSKPLDSNKINYAGSWMSADSRVSLTITPEGRIEYSNQQPGKSSSLSAPIQSFNGDNFEAGVGPFSTEFKVTQVPTQDAQGNWYMIVDGYTLAKRS